MAKSKYQAMRDKKITNSYCKDFPMLKVIDVLRKDNKSDLWNKFKKSWTIEDWKEFFKIKIDDYERGTEI